MSCQSHFCRLLILTTERHWVTLLDALLAEQAEPVWLFAANSWQDAQHLYQHDLPDLIFCTPECRPAIQHCSLPPVLLLERAPQEPLVMPRIGWRVIVSTPKYYVAVWITADSARRCKP